MISGRIDIKAIVNGILVFCILLLLAFIIEGGIVHRWFGRNEINKMSPALFWTIHTAFALIRYGVAARVMMTGLKGKHYLHAMILFILGFTVFLAFTAPIFSSGISEITELYAIEISAGIVACLVVAFLRSRQTTGIGSPITSTKETADRL